MMTIEVGQSDTDDEAVAMQLFADAKREHETSGARPTALVALGEDRYARIELADLGDFSDPETQRMALDLVRMFTMSQRSEFVAIMADTSVTRVEDCPPGVDPQSYRDWSSEMQARHPVRRRQALTMTMEARSGLVMVYQFYRGRPGAIVWEECLIERHPPIAGRLLPVLQASGAS